jgi:uncharacterized protein YdhG (YjbR/CyaY superfamily)
MPARSAAVDAYIAALPMAVQVAVEAARSRILSAAPEMTEGMSYGMPTYSLDGGYVVYMAAWKRHISLYPTPDGDEALRAELAPFRAGRGTLRFPLGQEIPEGLVERVVRALVEGRRSRAGSS